MTEAIVTVESLGAGGDGIARLDGRRLFLPYTLPGERWRVRLGAKIHGGRRAIPLERVEGPARASPVCPHFGHCGGCGLQHLPEESYRRFELERIREPLARRGLDPIRTDPPSTSPLHSRRRLRLAWQRRGRRLALGFRAARSHAVVPVSVCPIARPELVALLAPLQELLARLEAAGTRGELLLTSLDAGIDLLLDWREMPDLPAREGLAAFAEARDLARLSLRPAGSGGPEPLVVRRRPVLRYGPFGIPFPPGAFLQATAEGEAALRAFVADATSPGMRVADLYAGLGALSLPLAERLSRLALFEASEPAVAAVSAALRSRPGSAVAIERRDLAKRPLTVEELAGFDLVILDPPRAGARAQAEMLATAPLARLVYISCNPASFARDAAILAAGGWHLARLCPVDQFLFAADVEIGALFLRDGGDRT